MKRFETKRDGLTIRGTVYGTITDQPKPAVILSHGFMANASMCRAYAKLIAEAGYLAYTYDFCGGGLLGRSEGRTEDMSVLTEKEDLKAVIRHVSDLPSTASIHLLGCSQGGFVSALTAAELKEQISSLVLLYPAFCIPDDARKGQMMFARFDPKQIPDKIDCGPMKLGAVYVKNVIEIDPYEEIRPYSGPVLLLHGTKDTIVDVSYARRAAETYRNCQYIEIAGGTHMFRGVHEKMAQDCIRTFVMKQIQERK